MSKPTPTYYIFHGDDIYAIEAEVAKMRERMGARRQGQAGLRNPRPDRPKPFLPLLGKRTLFQQTLDRVAGILARLEAAGAGGNLTTDAQIAAIASRHRATVHTADTDFSRFPDVRWINPIVKRLG